MSAPTSSSSNSRRTLWLGLGGGAFVMLCLCLAIGVGGGVALYLDRKPPVSEGAAVMYVLDASPRMALPGETGAPRLTAARGVLAEIVRPADPSVLAGLRVFGTGAVNRACQDTNLLVPLATSSQKLISDKASSLEVGQSANSALAQAIVSAIRDLATKKGPHSLIVVTGGADSCNPNAAQVVAQEAKRSGIDLETYVIGFGVSDSEAQAIKVVIDQTPKARYVDAKDEAKLRSTLRGLQDRIDHPASSYIGQNACDYPYNPLRKGATWEYATAGGLYSETVTAVTGGASQATVTEAYDSGFSRGTFDITCGPNGIEGFQYQIGAFGQGGSAQVTMTTHSGWTLVPPIELAPGATWQSSVGWSLSQEANGQTLNLTYLTNSAYTAVGVERVTTPAGTFDAIRVDNTETIVVSGPPGIFGSTGVTETTSSLTYWYARDVGLVKMMFNGDKPMVIEELVAYSVPGTPSASRAAFTPPAAVVTATLLPAPSLSRPPSTPSASRAAATPPAAVSGAAAPNAGPGFGSLLGDFPLYPGATLDQSGTFEENNHGQFGLQSEDPMNQVSQFYDKELPARGWSLSYVVITTSGGPIKWWSKDNLRLQLNYMPADEGKTPATNLTGVYRLLDPAKARAFLPPDFPLPDRTEFVDASSTQVDLFVRQDYAAVVAFYKRQQAALAGQGWTQGTATSVEASCGGDPGCGGSQQYNWPAGTNPIPWPTADPRGNTALMWISPDKDEYLIQISPDQQDTKLSVAITLKNPARAGLPADVPVYQGAVVQLVSPGMLSYQAPASMDAVTKFYDGALSAAGWQVEPIQIPDLKMWKKGALEISVMVQDVGPKASNVMISCTGCIAP